MRSRPLALFLSLFLILSSFFIIPVGASDSSNILDSNLTNWDCPDSVSVNSYKNDIYRIYFNGFDITPDNPDYSTTFVGIRLKTSLVPQHNYTVSIKFPSAADINKALGTSLTDSQIISSLNSSSVKVLIGIAYARSGAIAYSPSMCKSFTGSDFIQNYYGSSLAFDFTYETVTTGEPHFIIGFSVPTDYSNYTLVYVSDPVLSDNTTSESDSLLSRLFAFFTEKLQDLRDKLNSALDGVKQGIVSALDSLKEGFVSALSSLGDKLQSFFTGCINLVLYFDWDGNYTNPFDSSDSPISSISSFLSDIQNYVSDSVKNFNTIIDSISGSIFLFDSFVQRYDWLFLLVSFSLVFIVLTRFIGL